VAPLPPPPPPPPPELPRGGREHDGFYLRLGLGLSYVVDSVQSTVFDEASMSGAGLADELAIGGTPAPGLVVGGAIQDASAFAPALRIDGDERDGGPSSLGLSLIGPFLDYYFDPAQGLHAQALVGLGVLTADDSRDLPVGFGASVGIGYEWWVGGESSLGLTARLVYARLSYDPSGIDERHSVLAPSLMGVYTYH